MVGLIAPRQHGFLGFKLHNGNPLPIVGGKSFDGNETRHFDGEVVNLFPPTLVFLPMLGPQP